jgi:branched-chain amino acid transport system substrate-binding protein
MGNKSLVRTLALIGVAGLFMTGCTAKTTTTTTTKKAEVKAPYKIGAILSVTGANAPLGEAEKKALLMEVEKINKVGGAGGHQLELVLEDDESDTAKAVAAVNKLIKVDKVVAVIGGTGTGTSMGIKPIVTSSMIPYISMAAGDVITAPDNKWVFRAPGKNSLAADKALEYIEKTLKVKKIAVLYDSNPFGQDGINMITKSAPARGLSIVASEKYETNAADVTSQLTNIKAANPDVVIVWGTNPMPAKAAQTMKQLGITVPYVGSHGIANATFITLAGDAANGVVFPAGKLILPASITDKAQKTAVDAFIKDFKAKYPGETPNTFAGHAYDSLRILNDALTVAGSDPAKLRTQIEKTKNFAGPDGIYKYSATNHDGLALTDFVMVKIEAGKWTQVK